MLYFLFSFFHALFWWSREETLFLQEKNPIYPSLQLLFLKPGKPPLGRLLSF